MQTFTYYQKDYFFHNQRHKGTTKWAIFIVKASQIVLVVKMDGNSSPRAFGSGELNMHARAFGSGELNMHDLLWS